MLDDARRIEALGMRTLVADTVMRSVADRERLAREALALRGTIRRLRDDGCDRHEFAGSTCEVSYQIPLNSCHLRRVRRSAGPSH